jgi:hypothetical protein
MVIGPFLQQRSIFVIVTRWFFSRCTGDGQRQHSQRLLHRQRATARRPTVVAPATGNGSAASRHVTVSGTIVF